jgi:hypothetical protein
MYRFCSDPTRELKILLGQAPSGPVIVLEFPKGTLKFGLGEHGFMRLRNIGGRAAEQIRVAPVVHGTWRIDFEEIHALAPSGHAGDNATLEYATHDDGQHFSNSQHPGSPEHGLVTFLEQMGSIARIPLTIEYRDGNHTRYTVQDIDYESVHKTVRVRKGVAGANSFRAVPLIEPSPAADALNLRITNFSPVDLEANKLLLHSVRKWNEQARELQKIPPFDQFTTVTLYGNQTGLPSGEPR